MIIYLDLIFFMNFFYDLLLILTVSISLKRQRPFYYYVISALFGSGTILLLFLNINSTILLSLKIISSIIMCLIAFGFVSFKYLFNNLLYLYMSSAILAGFLYFVDLQTSLDHKGIIFFFKDVNPNWLLLILLSPCILFLYYKSSKRLKNTYSLYYNIEIHFDNTVVKCLSLFDNGNTLKDPISKKAIIIVNKNILAKVVRIRAPVYVPYHTVSGVGLMSCYKPSFIIINHHRIDNYLVGITDHRFSDGVNCLLNKQLMEDNYV